MKGEERLSPTLVLLLFLAFGAGLMLSKGKLDLGGLIGTEEAETPETEAEQGVFEVSPQITVEEGEGIGKGIKLPIETLKAQAKDKYTMDPVQGIQFKFYTPGADVTDPNVKPLDTITTGSDGVGSTTNMIIQTNTDYDVWVNGSSTYYDEKIEDWEISYNPDRGVGFLLIGGQAYYPAIKVGAFVDVATLPEVQSCMNDTSDDTVYYDISACGGSAWFRVDIGNANANSELHNVVMCFMDLDGDMEGDEITAFSAAYVSGKVLDIPGNLLGYWQDGMGAGAKKCREIASVLGPSEKGRYEFTITVNEANFEVGEEFQICFDDVGDYSAKQYPSRNAKATAECLTVAVQA